MIIIHGENTVNSRQKLVEIITDKKAKDQEIFRLEAKKLSEANLEEILGATDLFGTSKTIIIEELHSLPTSNKKKNFIELLSKPQTHDIILWEKRLLTKTMLNKFPNAQIYEYKISKTLFAWLDLLGSKDSDNKKLNLLHSAIETDGDFFCFLMLIRQIRSLVEIKSGGLPKGAPFMISKIKAQASKFSLEKLLDLYEYLLKIDQSQKTSKSNLNLLQTLDLLTLKM
ncbi:MAG: hypothetical protein H6772_04895 [Pseudomonadales bacterium]|nr:hypothetical protein [Pseudomonadales bacterium]